MTHLPITDPEVLAFIAQTEACYPPATRTPTVAQSRATYDAMCDVFRTARPAGVAVVDQLIAGVPCRIYNPAARALVLYAHGGGMMLGGLDSHDDICAEIADFTGARVVSVDYRLAPEHRAPAQLDDVHRVWQALDADGVVCGDSAGGTLVAGLCHRIIAQGGRMPLAQVLIYPGLGGDGTALSYVENATAPLLTTAEVASYRALIPDAALTCPETAPLQARDVARLPATFIFTADVDPLRDDGFAYAGLLARAGVGVVLRNDGQLVHGWLRARHQSRLAARAFGAILSEISQALTGAPKRAP